MKEEDLEGYFKFVEYYERTFALMDVFSLE
jgi:hypothetical protein